MTLDDDTAEGLRGEEEGGDIFMRRCRSSAKVSVLVESDASLAAFGVVIVTDRHKVGVQVYRFCLGGSAEVSASLL